MYGFTCVDTLLVQCHAGLDSMFLVTRTSMAALDHGCTVSGNITFGGVVDCKSYRHCL